MQNQQQGGMTLKEKMELIKTLLCLPSFSVIVFLRYRIGYRILDKGYYLLVALVVYLIGFFNYEPQNPYPSAISWYAGGIVVMGAIHRMIAWMQLSKGTQPHSYSTGISWLGFRFLPRWLRSPGFANAMFDPLLTAITGFVVREKYSPALGTWLIIAAASTLFLEIILSVKSADRDMDVADGLIMAEVQADASQRFKRGGVDAASEGRTPVATGLGRDIRLTGRLQRR